VSVSSPGGDDSQLPLPPRPASALPAWKKALLCVSNLARVAAAGLVMYFALAKPFDSLPLEARRAVFMVLILSHVPELPCISGGHETAMQHYFFGALSFIPSLALHVASQYTTLQNEKDLNNAGSFITGAFSLVVFLCHCRAHFVTA